MTAAELIAALGAFPADAQVAFAYDGAARGNVYAAWLSRGGEVVLASEGEPIHYERDRPITLADAPTLQRKP